MRPSPGQGVESEVCDHIQTEKKTVSTHIFEIIFVENLSFFSFSHDYFEGNTDFTRIKHIRVLNDNDSITHSAYFH